MQGWIEGLQSSIDFIEQHLTDELDIEEIAGKAALSPFYYQRIFGALCGMTVGEYIRARRMSQAAQELARTNAKVIDIALKYGYDSPDSFTKAFLRFHGVSPSRARESGAPMRSFAPLHIKISLEGGSMMDYRIVEKAPFTIVGVKKPFNSDTSYEKIPKFWNEWLAQGEDRPVKGTFGVCIDMKGKDFDYWIADLTTGSRIYIFPGRMCRKAAKPGSFLQACGHSFPAPSGRCRIRTQKSGRSGSPRCRDTHWPENTTLRSIFLRKKAPTT